MQDTAQQGHQPPARPTTVRIPTALRRAVDAHAAKQARRPTFSELTRAALAKHVGYGQHDHPEGS
jgi:hypothetical protein